MEQKINYNGDFKGVALVKIPKYTERMKALKELNFNFEGETLKINNDTFDSLAKMEGLAKKYLVKIELTHVKSKLKFESLEELEPYAEYQKLVQDITNVVLNGAKLGN